MRDHVSGHLCRGRRIQMSGHSHFGILNGFGASSILPGVHQILHQLFVLRTWQSGYDIHDF